jgi:16S rRNA (uracil1498-N3)-methyltransferase
MHRFFLPPPQCSGPILRLEDREAHHAAQVLRLAPGDLVTVLDGAGNEFRCATSSVHRRTVELAVTERKFHAPLPAQLTLVSALTKGRAFEVIVQKSTELGAHAVVPLLTERVVTRFADPADAAAKVEKWRQIAIESIKQCGSPWLPEIHPPVALAEYLTCGARRELEIIGALAGDRQHPRSVLAEFHRQHQRRPHSLAAWVGPEGDFTPAELAAILARGVVPITLGSNVLRAETAAIYCLSVLSYELQSPPALTP